MIAWGFFFVYVIGTIILAWLGSRKTNAFENFAIGNRRMNPLLVGITLAATMTSTATFVINPGIVYAFGVSAIFGYGVSAGLGLMLGIVVLSKGFRRIGIQSAALTVPQWIGTRFNDQRFTVIYAVFNLLLIAMVVLISYGTAIVMDATLGLAYIFPTYHFEIALAFIILFVFSYITFGGAYAHAYTNTIQGVIMLGIALLLIYSGLPYLKVGLLATLAAENPNLTTAINPQSFLFRNFFEVFIANFLIGFALAVQPHFITKSLYVQSDRDVNRYLTVAVMLGIVFSFVLMVGLFARAQFGPAHMAQVDMVVTHYILGAFPLSLAALVSIALLAAGMSTLDGILVALSAIFANDFYLVLARKRLEGRSTQERYDIALKVGRYALLGLAILAFALGYLQHHYKEFSVAIFAQTWLYGLFSVTFIPLLFGMFVKDVNKWWVLTASLVSFGVHLVFRYGKLSILTNADYLNPGLTASYGIIVSLLIMGVYYILPRKEKVTA